MMGSESAATIRKRVRESYKMTDAELLALFNRQIEEASRKADNQTAIDTLRILRDALVKETKRPSPRRKARPKVKGSK